MTKLPKKINPSPVSEAIFELRLNSNVNAATLLQKMYSQLLDDFPEIEPLMMPELPTEILEKQPNLRYSPQFRLKNSDFLVSIGPRVVTVNNVCIDSEYVGWELFASTIKNVLRTLRGLEVVNNIERVSLKFINLLEDATPDKVLDIDVNFLDKHLHDLSEFSLFTSANLGNDYKLNLGISANTTIEYKTVTKKGLSITVDIFNEKVSDIDESIGAMDKLHTHSKQAFFGVVKENFVESLSPEYE